MPIKCAPDARGRSGVSAGPLWEKFTNYNFPTDI